MAYFLIASSAFNKDAKALSDSQKEFLKKLIKDIQLNPTLGKFLKGNLVGYRSVAFSRSPELRLIYQVHKCHHENGKCAVEECQVKDSNDCSGYLHLNFVKTREECNNLYARKKRYFEKQKRNK